MEKSNNVSSLFELIKTLRSENGCPWDKKQTPSSMAVHLVEEAFEAYEAIHCQSDLSVMDELGDTLFQLCFIILLYQEKDLFTFDDVVNQAFCKMKSRHPHVFGEEKADTKEDVEKIWKNAKAFENSNNKPSLMDIPSGLPALTKALKISKNAVSAGFEWENSDDVFKKIHEEIDELQEAFRINSDKEKKETELGDVFFTMVNAGRFLNLESESSLLKSCSKFTKRFRMMEKEAEKINKKIEDLQREDLESLWNESKKIY
ncbi:MAG: nucleoside triphosphate pyrophosphohydrolase [Thermodesulfobacteriota bacterium]